MFFSAEADDAADDGLPVSAPVRAAGEAFIVALARFFGSSGMKLRFSMG
jgi:hypothetical protein